MGCGKGPVYKIKRKAKYYLVMFVNHKFNKWLVSWLCKELSELENEIKCNSKMGKT